VTLTAVVDGDAYADGGGVTVNYLDFFPGATTNTNGLFKVLTENENPPLLFNEMDWRGSSDLSTQLQDLFGQQYGEFDYGELEL